MTTSSALQGAARNPWARRIFWPLLTVLLLANIPVDDEAMRSLALQRGVAVKDYLIGLNLPAERLFLGAAKAVAPDANWSPRAELKLDNN
jgi:hypothetical protein